MTDILGIIMITRIFFIITCLALTTNLWANRMPECYPKQKTTTSHISIIPALSDNYIYLIRQNNRAIAIDPGDARPLLKALRKDSLTLTHILNTHHHLDHIGGNKIIKSSTNCTVIGPDDARIPILDTPVHEGENFSIGGLTFQVIFVPGHTRSHLAFFVPEKKWLFSGDTLFAGGCGRIFEGTPQQMLASLRKLMQLPKETLVFCGHEYTLKNLQFAAMIEPQNADIQQRLNEVIALRKQKQATVPTTLEIELKTNPFLRTDQPALKKALNMENDDDVAVFAAIRAMKDQF